MKTKERLESRAAEAEAEASFAFVHSSVWSLKGLRLQKRWGSCSHCCICTTLAPCRQGLWEAITPSWLMTSYCSPWLLHENYKTFRLSHTPSIWSTYMKRCRRCGWRLWFAFLHPQDPGTFGGPGLLKTANDRAKRESSYFRHPYWNVKPKLTEDYMSSIYYCIWICS